MIRIVGEGQPKDYGEMNFETIYRAKDWCLCRFIVCEMLEPKIFLSLKRPLKI